MPPGHSCTHCQRSCSPGEVAAGAFASPRATPPAGPAPADRRRRRPATTAHGRRPQPHPASSNPSRPPVSRPRKAYRRTRRRPGNATGRLLNFLGCRCCSVNPRLTHGAPARIAHPVRLDDLIDAIKGVHTEALDQLTDAVLAAEHLGEVADNLIGHFVDQARRSGASWDRHRQEHGGHQASGAEAVRAGDSRNLSVVDLDPGSGLQPVHPTRPQRDRRGPERRPRRRQRRDHPGCHLLLGLLKQSRCTGHAPASRPARHGRGGARRR